MIDKKRIVAGAAAFLVLVVGVLLLARPGSQQQQNSNKIQVVAAENFWGNIAQQIGGQNVQVTSIITDPSTDPHLYESNAQNAAAVSSAKLVITNGLGYDDFMDKLLAASSGSNRTVLNAATTVGAQDGSNQHLWYSYTNVNAVAAKMAAAYETVDSAHARDYQNNLTSFEQSLQPLVGLINQIKQRYAGTPVAYTEPVPGYLLQAADLKVMTPEGFAKSIEDGDDPSPADAQAMDTLMTAKSVKVLLYNSQATSPVTEHIKDLAKQSGIAVIGVTETLPANAKNYQSWQQDQLNQLLDALES